MLDLYKKPYLDLMKQAPEYRIHVERPNSVQRKKGLFASHKQNASDMRVAHYKELCVEQLRILLITGTLHKDLSYAKSYVEVCYDHLNEERTPESVDLCTKMYLFFMT